MATRTRSRRRSAERPIAEKPRRRMRMPTVDAAGAERIFDGVLDILHTVGMLVEDAEARALLTSAGCREDGGRVYYPPDLVRRTLETIPRRITFFNQNGDMAFATDDATARFGTAVNCVQVLDPRTDAYRPCLLSDIADHGRVQDRLPNIDFVAALGYPSDVDAEAEALASARALLDTTRKPIFVTGHDEHGVRAIWDEMARKFGVGIDVSSDTIATEVVARAATDNSFLTDPHMLARYETEMWIPELFQREGIENWQEAGQPDLRARLKEKTMTLLEGP